MVFMDDFADMFTQTVSHAGVSSRDTFGSPTYGSATSYSARVVYKNRRVRDFAGAEVVSTAQAWIKGAPSISPIDRVTLPDGSTPVIASVEKYPDEDGDLVTKVYFL